MQHVSLGEPGVLLVDFRPSSRIYLAPERLLLALVGGALGFSISRTLNHRALKGDPTPSLRASEEELLGMKDAGHAFDEETLLRAAAAC